ncbi:MAG: hypothetical protein RLZZ360_707 [Candidatus Parcubacteria bacterium]|jgi:bifunctional pyridoxal-dependent enzyme with beta-cystathionase and maltose regulon repressor activities
MKAILKFFRKRSENPRVAKSPVYEFFAEATATEKKKAYRKALKGASDDQLQLLSRYSEGLSNAQ